jgi:hypothetical protein
VECLTVEVLHELEAQSDQIPVESRRVESRHPRLADRGNRRPHPRDFDIAVGGHSIEDALVDVREYDLASDRGAGAHRPQGGEIGLARQVRRDSKPCEEAALCRLERRPRQRRVEAFAVEICGDVVHAVG